MNSFTRYAAVNTKIRAMEAGFLNSKDFFNLLSKKNVAEVASYLKSETHYRNVLNDVDVSSIHRRQLEVLIKKDHAEQIGRLIHYFYDGYREFFKYIFYKREVNELKAILRGITNEGGEHLSRENFVLATLKGKVNTDRLIASKSISEFISNLRGTVYYKYLKYILEGNHEGELFLGEMAIDLAYFDIFYDLLEEIKGTDRKIVNMIQGINADLLNIQWIYRGLKYYSMPREILFNYTIPYGLEFNKKEILNLCYSKDNDELQKKVLKTRYKFLFDNENTKDIFMERRTLRYQYFNIREIERKREMNISGIIAFDVLLDYEIRDLVTVIESIRYEIPAEEAKKYLIRKL